MSIIIKMMTRTRKELNRWEYLILLNLLSFPNIILMNTLFIVLLLFSYSNYSTYKITLLFLVITISFV